MRFLYGFILGLLGTLIAAILYLALGGGEYLLVISPRYHEMKTRLDVLEKTEQQRDHLAAQLQALEERFQKLASRFEGLDASARPQAEGRSEPGAAAEPATGESGAEPPPTP